MSMDQFIGSLVVVAFLGSLSVGRADAVEFCGAVHNHTVAKLSNYSIVRYGYQNIAEAVGSAHSSGPALYFVSTSFPARGGLAWSSEPPLIHMDISSGYWRDLYYFAMGPENFREELGKNSIRSMAQPWLRFVYDRYQGEAARREIITPELIAGLRAGDNNAREQDWTMWSVNDLNGRTEAVLGLYQHSPDLFELMRLGKRPESKLDLQDLLPLVSEYLRSRGVRRGRIYGISDRLQARRLASPEIGFRPTGRVLRSTEYVEYLKSGSTVNFYDRWRPVSPDVLQRLLHSAELSRHLHFHSDMSIEDFLRRHNSDFFVNGNGPIVRRTILDEPFFFHLLHSPRK